MKIDKNISTGLLLIFMFFGTLGNLMAQWDIEEETRKGRFFIAPDIGVLLGTVTRLEISPVLGYHLVDRISLGFGGRYEYYNSKNPYPVYQTNIWGIRSLVRYEFIRDLHNIIPLNILLGIFGHLEFEALNLDSEVFRTSAHYGGRYWYNTALMGIGFIQRTGLNSAITVVALWDSNTSTSSPYSSPIMRFGFQFYL
jgi:hypothetical protein